MANESRRRKQERAIRTFADMALEFFDQEKNLPARDTSPEELGTRLGVSLPRVGVGLEETMAKLRAVLAATPSAASPRFLNQLFGGRDLPATVAELLTALTNTSMYTYKVAGAQVLVERECLQRMLQAVPYGEGEGMFAPGASLANMTAMLIARNRRFTKVRQRGFAGERGAIYTSAEAHYSIRKAAGLLGLGRDSVRSVPTDNKGSMAVDALTRLIEGDLQDGIAPILVNATVGTTVAGAIDPIMEIARVCNRFGVWLHVDGALGGSILLSKKYRHLLAGVELSNSLTWNAHKMMGVPLPCSVLLLKDSHQLEGHLGEHADYLFQTDEAGLNPGTRSLQCGRRNDALKLWAAWQALGDQGFDRRLTRLLDLARTTARLIDEDPALELHAKPHTVTVCLRVPGVASADICDHLDRHSILKIGHGLAGADSAIRLVFVDPDLDEVRLKWILTQIKAAAREVAIQQGAG